MHIGVNIMPKLNNNNNKKTIIIIQRFNAVCLANSLTISESPS